MSRTSTLCSMITLTVLAALATSVTPIAVSAQEKAIAPEHNPPGDIPDSQIFIDYKSASFSMKVPEGWSRKDKANGAVFSDKYNTIDISATDTPSAPTVETVKTKQVADIVASPHAAKVQGIKDVNLKGGSAIKIDYQSNSDANAVTGKQIRLERVEYLYFKAGHLVTLDMAAPAGADNVDQWLLMANSVRLK